MSDETETLAEQPRDETHDSIDPTTGAPTAEAMARRSQIMEELRAAGHAIQSWADALAIWANPERRPVEPAAESETHVDAELEDAPESARETVEPDAPQSLG